MNNFVNIPLNTGLNDFDLGQKNNEATPHFEILNLLIDDLEKLDFVVLAFPQSEKIKKEIEKLTQIEDKDKVAELTAQLEKLKVKEKHYLILSIENLLKVAKANDFGLCKNNDFIYLYNGAYWSNIDKENFQKFLGEASEKMGVAKFDSRHYQFIEKLFKQFIATAYQQTPVQKTDTVLVNLKNGTFKVSPNGTNLSPFDRSDFITYQLPFDYTPKAKAPLFEKYLNQVLPDVERQKILAEYLGYVFIQPSTLKLEKTLLLYGTGANGKSVFFEIVNALFGSNNVSSYTLQNLTDDKGYHRAKLANILINYSSEINGKLETSIFKQLVSGEPVEARLPYGEPFTMSKYAKLIFNCNELPKEVEHTNAFFRRFMIVPFDVTIAEDQQDKELSKKIINNELSGVFNWVLDGLNRVLAQKNFSYCEASNKAREVYETESDSVKMFIDSSGYEKSLNEYELASHLYTEYKKFCDEDGYRAVGKKMFLSRLNSFGVQKKKLNTGNVLYLKKVQKNNSQ